MNEQAQPAGSDPMMTGSINTTTSVESSPMPAPVTTSQTATSDPNTDTLYRRWKQRKVARESGQGRTTLFGKDEPRQASSANPDRRRLRIFKDKPENPAQPTVVAAAPTPGQVDTMTTQSVGSDVQSRSIGAPASAMPAAVDSQPGGWSAKGGTTMIVSEGQTLYSISRRYGIPVEALMEANSLDSPMQLSAGQQLILPNYSKSSSAAVSTPAPQKKLVPVVVGQPASTRTTSVESKRQKRQEPAIVPVVVAAQPAPVQPASVAPAVVAPVRSVSVANTSPTSGPRRKPYGSVSQAAPVRQVSLTPVKTVAPSTKPKRKRLLAKKQTPKPVVTPAGSYVVVGGDTIWQISSKTGVPRADLLAANGLTSTTPLQIGQKLIVPDTGKTARLPAVKTAKTSTANSALPTPVKAPKVAAVKVDAPKKAAKSNKLRWPATGKIVSSFGDVNNGRKNVGINLSVAEGTAVRSASAGTVVYVGDQIANYGNLILIRHGDGLVTAYAHNKSLLVTKGEKVGRGQVIARAGSTGDVSRPQIHFEVRKGSQPVDPLTYLAQS
jgi:murein DD-endopeptidase MepM/ murein hydrolase activator NlpD